MSKKTETLIVPNEIISLEEFSIRQKAWDEYYEKVKDTKVYILHLKIREAYKLKTKSIQNNFKELLEENRKIMLEEQYELTKPNFEDPTIAQLNNKLGIDSFWKSQIEQARIVGREVVYKDDKAKEITEPPTLEF